MTAVLETGGKQYHVDIGDVIKTEKLDAEVGSVVEFENILLFSDEKVSKKEIVGTPYVKGAKVTAEVLDQTKHDKVIVFKKKRRKNYKRKYGHKHHITILRIKEIIG